MVEVLQSNGLRKANDDMSTFKKQFFFCNFQNQMLNWHYNLKKHISISFNSIDMVNISLITKILLFACILKNDGLNF